MLRTNTALALAAVASLACAASSCGTGRPDLGPTGTGVLTLSEQSWDFGDVPIGVLVDHTFTLANTGTGPVRLDSQVAVDVLEGC